MVSVFRCFLLVVIFMLAACGEKSVDVSPSMKSEAPVSEVEAAPVVPPPDVKSSSSEQVSAPEVKPAFKSVPKAAPMSAPVPVAAEPQPQPTAPRKTGPLTEAELEEIRAQYPEDESVGKKHAGRTYVATGKVIESSAGVPFQLRIDLTKSRMAIFSVWCVNVIGAMPFGDTVTVSGTLAGEVYVDDVMGESLFMVDCSVIAK